jgi:Asp-tRNA(Asn)/Glu-tRNA(Gln) amidotransferase A subunit family amidase
MRKGLALALLLFPSAFAAVSVQTQSRSFRLEEATVADIHAAFRAGRLTARQLVQMYLDRIDAIDKTGPKLNSIISINSKALEEADRLDAAFKRSGLVGPLHGIPVVLKDMIDAAGMPTTEGSIVLKDFYPDKDAFIVDRMKKAGAIVLAKTTLSEYATGDTYGSLFGATKNPYDLRRTPGGSSGGTGASVAANLAAVGIGEEGLASIRRPSSWNGVVGMKPTPGLVSRTGMFAGWPGIVGGLGPMTRSVEDLARIMDVITTYDAEDPLTALGVANRPDTYVKSLDRGGLKGARLGIIRESIGENSEPASEDFRIVNQVFERTVGELRQAGAVLVDPLLIPDLKTLLATPRAGGAIRTPEGLDAVQVYFRRNANPPFRSRQDMAKDPNIDKVFARARGQFTLDPPRPPDPARTAAYQAARDALMVNVLKVMADNNLDAIVYKSVEHQPVLIPLPETATPEELRIATQPPAYVDTKGVPTLNTFLVYVPAITVPAGFTPDNLPTGVTFQGRPYSDALMIKLAYAYEQATHHRKPPTFRTGGTQ